MVIIVTIYDKKTTKSNFNNNGLGILDECMIVEITTELNGDYSLYIEYPANSSKANHLIEFNIIKVQNELFRIYKVEREQYNIRSIKVWARHIFYDLAFYFIESVNLMNANMKEAIEGSFPPEAQATFNFIAPERNIYPVKMKNVNTLEALFQLISIYKGELKRSNYNVEIVEQLGVKKDIIIRYGKNIKGLKAIIDTNEFATRIYPIGDNNLILPERYIEASSEVVNILPYPITKKVEFIGCKDLDDLRELAKEYIKQVSNPLINISVDYLELSKTEEFEEYESLFNLELGDIVKVKHDKLGIYSELRVIKIVKDILKPINTKIELGNPLNTIVSKLDFTSIVERLESKIDGVQNEVILKKNKDLLLISNTSYYATLIVGINALADTNLSCNVIMNGIASSDLILYFKFMLDGEYFDFQPSQSIASGENIVNLTIPIPQVTVGTHSFVVEIKTSIGTFSIDKNNLQIMIEGRHLEGGLNPSLPRAEVIQYFLYDLFLNKISSYKANILLDNNCTLKSNIQNEINEIIGYEYFITKDPSNHSLFTKINMGIVGIIQKADNTFLTNLESDRWLNHFSEMCLNFEGYWEEINYITIIELTEILESAQYNSLGTGLIYEISLSDRNQYNKVLEIKLMFEMY